MLVFTPCKILKYDVVILKNITTSHKSKRFNILMPTNGS